RLTPSSQSCMPFSLATRVMNWMVVVPSWKLMSRRGRGSRRGRSDKQILRGHKALGGSHRNYQNYLDEDEPSPDWLQRYYGPNLERLLLAVQRAVDPHNVFRHSRSIPAPLS